MTQQQETLLVFGIPQSTPVGEIEKYFAREGTVVKTLLWKEGAIVQYFNHSEATRAVTKLNKRSFKGDTLDIHSLSY